MADGARAGYDAVTVERRAALAPVTSAGTGADAAMELSRAALAEPARSTWVDRATLVANLGRVLSEHANELEMAVANDSDKLAPDAAAEVRSAIDACVFYGRNAEHWPPRTSRPIGIVVVQTPLGNTLWRVTRVLLPVLLGGGGSSLARGGPRGRSGCWRSWWNRPGSRAGPSRSSGTSRAR